MARSPLGQAEWESAETDPIPLPSVLELETWATCNRTCPTCLRNSLPDRTAAASWFIPSGPTLAGIAALLADARDHLGFRGAVCLSHYNEPLQDERLPAIARLVRRADFASSVFLHTNGDLITTARAQALDGLLDWISVALYMDEPAKSQRAAWIRSQFSSTRVDFTGGGHIPTHFSPDFPVADLARAHQDHPCSEPGRRLIINHRGEMLFCCDDLIGHFSLGRFPDRSLRDLWFDARHQALVRRLETAGGRHAHPHCLSCPRP